MEFHLLLLMCRLNRQVQRFIQIGVKKGRKLSCGITLLERKELREPHRLVLNGFTKLPLAIVTASEYSGRIVSSEHSLLQLCELGLGLFQDGDVGVCVFPEDEEVLICRLGFGGFVLQGI